VQVMIPGEFLFDLYVWSWITGAIFSLLTKFRMRRKCPNFYDEVYRADLSIFSPSYGWYVAKKTFLFWRTFQRCCDVQYKIFASIAGISLLIVYLMTAVFLLITIILVLQAILHA